MRLPPGGRIGGARLLACATVFVAGGMVATPATDHFNLESDIPTAIEDIEPTDRGSVELQAYGRYLRQREEENAGEAEFRAVGGVFDKTQLDLHLRAALWAWKEIHG